MKDTKVPEESLAEKKLSPEEQLAMLRNKLAGNKVFGRCRGKFDDLPYEKIIGADRRTCPSRTLRSFDRWAADRRVMLHYLAFLKRDGHDVAFDELCRALCSDHIITGESVPIEKSEPGVLIMFDVKKTTLMIRWLYSSRFEDAESFMNTGSIPENRGQCGSLTSHLLEQYPSLDQHFKQMNRARPASPTVLLEPDINFAWKTCRDKFSLDQVLWMCIDPRRTGTWYGPHAVAIFIKQAAVRDVVKLFSRPLQKRMAVWRFQYPQIDVGRIRRAWGHGPDLWIGLHPESEHEKWKSLWPSYASMSCSGGLGAVIVNEEKMGESNHTKCFDPYTNIRSPYPQFCEGDLMKRRVVIGFPYSPDL